ncbi:hypothetical protein L0F63_002693 [Massospora cicadina]|nr:hypothetical protein L0F63_002693 [Massospora cicadina]
MTLGPEAPELAPQTPEVTPENKIFVGNLPLGHKAAQLRELFSPAGKITKMMARNRRHSLYAFVTFETADEVEKAIELFNGVDVGGQPLRVEKAVSKVFKGPRKPKKKGAKKPAGKSDNGGKDEEDRSTDKENGTSSSIKWNPEAESWAIDKSDADGWSDHPEQTVTNNPGQPEQPSTNSRRKGRGRGGFRPRRKRTPANREPSPITLYVSNLPFTLSDEGFQQVFASFKVQSAHVVRNKASGRSKGYGFVEFESNAEQQRALSELGIVEINGRALYISVALSKPFVPAEVKSEKEQDSTEAPETQEGDTPQ